MTKSPKPPARVAKARVMYAHLIPLTGLCTFIHIKRGRDRKPVAVIPTRTRREAREICRLHSMTVEQRMVVAGKAIAEYYSLQQHSEPGVFTQGAVKAMFKALNLPTP